MNESYSIEVLFSTISAEQYNSVINQYNLTKPEKFYPIQKLDRVEGGFEIVVDPTNIYLSKQLRWNRKRLVSHFDYLRFTPEETILLYDALCYVFKEGILLHLENNGKK